MNNPLRIFLLTLALIVKISPTPAQAQVTTPTLTPTDKQAALVASKQKEYDDSVRSRTSAIPRLPANTITFFDVAYETHPIQGSYAASNQTLDLYVPAGKGPFPLIVFYHGGAWKGGDKGRRGSEMALAFVPSGFAVASVDYRFVHDAVFPGMFQDSIDAMAFLRAHANEYHIDSSRIGVIGESAGGHIAGVVGLAEGESKSPYANVGGPVQAVVLLCGFYDLTSESGQWHAGQFPINPRDDFAQLYPNRTYDPVIAKEMSPSYHIRPGLPPLLVVHGDKDTIAPILQSQIFVDALKQSGANVTFSNYPNYTHNLWHPDVIAEINSFFQKNLSAKP